MAERVSTLIQSALAMTIGILQFTAVAGQAADYDVGSLHLAQPWSRATPKGANAGAAYLTVTNNGAAPDRLSCAGSDAAAQCQIHTMSMENGVMKMRPVEGGLEIKPGETVTLKPGSQPGRSADRARLIPLAIRSITAVVRDRERAHANQRPRCREA
jgi:copper(I)-binding protein